MTKKILFVVAYEGYQQVEYLVPKTILEDSSFQVITASNMQGTAIAKDGSTTTVDLLTKEVNVADYDAIFFIGGPGALEHLDNEESYNIIRHVQAAQKPFGAICVSTRILAHAGVLQGKSATGWDGDDLLGGIYQQHGVNYIKEDVVTDGLIVTAVGPKVAQEFGEAIVALLASL